MLHRKADNCYGVLDYMLLIRYQRRFQTLPIASSVQGIGQLFRLTEFFTLPCVVPMRLSTRQNGGCFLGNDVAGQHQSQADARYRVDAEG